MRALRSSQPFLCEQRCECWQKLPLLPTRKEVREQIEA
jgi:hypothetical protein